MRLRVRACAYIRPSHASTSILSHMARDVLYIFQRSIPLLHWMLYLLYCFFCALRLGLTTGERVGDGVLSPSCVYGVSVTVCLSVFKFKRFWRNFWPGRWDRARGLSSISHHCVLLGLCSITQGSILFGLFLYTFWLKLIWTNKCVYLFNSVCLLCHCVCRCRARMNFEYSSRRYPASSARARIYSVVVVAIYPVCSAASYSYVSDGFYNWSRTRYTWRDGLWPLHHTYWVCIW